MKTPLYVLVLAAIALLGSGVCIIANNVRIGKLESQVQDLEYLSRTSDGFLEEYTKSVYDLRDHIVMDDEALEYMHRIDSLAYVYYGINNFMDYNVYALDINYYYDRKRSRPLGI